MKFLHGVTRDDMPLGSIRKHGSNDTLTYQWWQDGGPPVTLKDAATATPSFVAPIVRKPTELIFKLKVLDGTQNLGTFSPGSSESDEDQVTITVKP